MSEQQRPPIVVRPATEAGAGVAAWAAALVAVAVRLAQAQAQAVGQGGPDVLPSQQDKAA